MLLLRGWGFHAQSELAWKEVNRPGAGGNYIVGLFSYLLYLRDLEEQNRREFKVIIWKEGG